MRSLAHLLELSASFVILAAAGLSQAQKEIANPQAIGSAKTIFFEDKSGVDVVGKKALAELRKWGRLQNVQDVERMLT